ncbi:MAG: DUF4065 domain-containing protein [Chloroflexi bacterium]|nr:DUF4065 domain-containing protein [Chloroflexota bacterium]
MTKATFNFDHKKATQALNLFAIKEGGIINKMKALKLVYLADRYHLRKYGRLITNDVYFALDNGPVASGVRDIVEASEFISDMERNYAACYLMEEDKYEVKSKAPFDHNVFSDSDIEAINFAWEKFGDLDQWELRDLTHKYPEWFKHERMLRLNSRIQMDINDFFDDPNTDVEKCFELTNKDKELRREHLEEISHLESLWR